MPHHVSSCTGVAQAAEPQQVSIQQAFQGPASRPGSAQPASDLRVLLNKANSCYINSIFTALNQSCQDIPVNGVEPVLAEMRVAVRSLARGWHLDGRQHDAAEFYTAVAPDSGPLQPVPWR